MKKNEHQVLEHLPGLRRYAYALCNHRTPIDPEDLVQECLARAIARFSQWQPGTDLRAWLFTMMHNLFINMLRKAARETTGNISETTEPATAATADPGMDDLDKALQTLSADQRSILMLVTLEGLTYQQIASMLQIPVGTVMSRLSRARQQLRDTLYQDENRGDPTGNSKAKSNATSNNSNIRYLK